VATHGVGVHIRHRSANAGSHSCCNRHNGATMETIGLGHVQLVGMPH
jgi:hypothetical protein